MSFLALVDIIVTVYNAASDWLTLYTNHIIFSILTCITQELVIGLSGSVESALIRVNTIKLVY